MNMRECEKAEELGEVLEAQKETKVALREKVREERPASVSKDDWYGSNTRIAGFGLVCCGYVLP